MAEEEEIGRVRDYFAHIGVAGIDLSARLKVGDTIHIKGHTTDLQQLVDSMQIEHENVQEAGPGTRWGSKSRSAAAAVTTSIGSPNKR